VTSEIQAELFRAKVLNFVQNYAASTGKRAGGHLLRRWPDEAGPWDLDAEFEIRNGRIRCTALKLTADAEPGIGPKITQGLLRDVSVVDLGREWALQVAGPLRQRGVDFDSTTGHQDAELIEKIATPPTIKRYSEVADAYRQAVAAGGHPNKAVAKRMGTSVKTAAVMVHRARKYGALEQHG
jgi:hypothetical protein